MARPKVPHCKECNFLRGFPVRPWESQGSWYCRKMQKPVDGQSVRTSPRWCPFRFSGDDNAFTRENAKTEN